jgi:hypothetical protein
LPLTADGRPAKSLAMTPRWFTNFDNRFAVRDFDSKFRPAFTDPIEMPVPFMNNSIAAYLMRNLAYSENSEIFEALKRDALRKATAAKDVVSCEMAKFDQAFRSRFNE